MANTYFRFKQFTVHQQNAAMKVCTDACLFGAVVADQVKTKSSAGILDIGTGTGLLSLLLAQKVPAQIDAVEIDEAAYKEAKENFNASPWKERLHVFNQNILFFSSDKKYDCIISNPPFFENDLKSSNENKNAAKHDTTLTLQQLFEVAQKHINEDGMFAILLPYHRFDEAIGEAGKQGFYPVKKILVKQTPAHHYFRAILLLRKQPPSLLHEETIEIKDEAGNYTAAFAGLLKDYYLYL